MVQTPERLGFEQDLQRLTSLFEQAEREVEVELARAIARDNQYTAAQRRAKQREIKGILEELRTLTLSGNPDDAAGPAWDLVRSAYRGGADRAAQAIAVESAFGSGIHQASAEILYENLSSRLEDSIAYVGRRVDDHFRASAMEELLQGAIQGRTREATSTAIAERLEAQGIKAFRARNGAEWSLKNYSEMVARTTAREAHTQGTVNRLAENGLDLVQISEHQHEDDICSDFEGQIFSISGNHPTYPPADGNLPPYHPNCVHVTTPFIERFNAPAV